MSVVYDVECDTVNTSCLRAVAEERRMSLMRLDASSSKMDLMGPCVRPIHAIARNGERPDGRRSLRVAG